MKNYKFGIITTTFNREEKIIRTINSILKQTYKNWEMIIIIDNPNLEYVNIKNLVKDNENTHIIRNQKNLGNNGSKNVALDNLSKETDYVTFLDDDDWFNQETLERANKIINQNPKHNWFVSNRILESGQKLTKNKTYRKIFRYLRDVMVLKRFTGDATHFINVKKFQDIRFSKKIKLTEEWFYFSQIPEKFLYYDFNSTIQDPHDKTNMTSTYNKNKISKLKNSYLLFEELFSLKNYKINFWIILYIPLRILAILIK